MIGKDQALVQRHGPTALRRFSESPLKSSAKRPISAEDESSDTVESFMMQAIRKGFCSWRSRIGLLSGTYLVAIVVVGLLGGGAVRYLTFATNDLVASSQVKLDAAVAVRLAIVGFDRHLQATIAETEPTAVKRAAVAVIREGSVIDESLDKLKKAYPGDASVEELHKLVAEARPVQMSVLSAAKNNDDAQALEVARSMQDKIGRINDLSTELVTRATSNTAQTLSLISERGDRVVAALVGAILVVVALGVLATVVFVRLLTRSLRHLTEGMTALESGDLTWRAPPATDCEIGHALGALAKTADYLNQSVGGIRENSVVVAGTSAAIDQVAVSLGDSAGELKNRMRDVQARSADLEGTLAASTTQLDRCASEVDQAADQVNQTASTVVAVADRFASLQSDLESTAQKTRLVIRHVGDVTSVAQTIKDIAERTNLLALNAAIEAARAGEQGRGFAVVADEVRKLATSSSDAVGKITAEVESIVRDSQDAISMLEQTVQRAEGRISELRDVASASMSGSARVTATRDDLLSLSQSTSRQKEELAQVARSVNAAIDFTERTQSFFADLHARTRELGTTSAQLNAAVGRFVLRQQPPDRSSPTDAAG